MRDVESLIRYFGFTWFLSDYGGNLKAFLDLTCERLNARWELEEAQIRQAAERCVAAIGATAIFGDHAFRRWSRDGWGRCFMTSGKPSTAAIHPREVARHHPGGEAAVFSGDRGSAVTAMAQAFARFRRARGAISAD